MDPTDTGGMGWLSSLLGGGGGTPAPASPAAPGQAPPTLDSAGLPAGGVTPPAAGTLPASPGFGLNMPTLMKGAQALGSLNIPKPPAAPAAPQLQMPQPHPQYAQALAQVMAQLNAKRGAGATLPQGTQ